MSSFIYQIKPPGRFTAGLKELWQYRELFYFFTWRDIKVRYKQTSLGILWALIQPLGMMALFTLLFRKDGRSIPVQSPTRFLFYPD
ncbi:MAG: ABC transporter permease [Chitinophagaceae bacterium]|nr:ABC transporter permease [Chitinophagaceae bacterium]